MTPQPGHRGSRQGEHGHLSRLGPDRHAAGAPVDCDRGEWNGGVERLRQPARDDVANHQAAPSSDGSVAGVAVDGSRVGPGRRCVVSGQWRQQFAGERSHRAVHGKDSQALAIVAEGHLGIRVVGLYGSHRPPLGQVPQHDLAALGPRHRQLALGMVRHRPEELVCQAGCVRLEDPFDLVLTGTQVPLDEVVVAHAEQVRAIGTEGEHCGVKARIPAARPWSKEDAIVPGDLEAARGAVRGHAPDVRPGAVPGSPREPCAVGAEGQGVHHARWFDLELSRLASRAQIPEAELAIVGARREAPRIRTERQGSDPRGVGTKPKDLLALARLQDLQDVNDRTLGDGELGAVRGPAQGGHVPESAPRLEDHSRAGGTLQRDAGLSEQVMRAHGISGSLLRETLFEQAISGCPAGRSRPGRRCDGGRDWIATPASRRHAHHHHHHR